MRVTHIILYSVSHGDVGPPTTFVIVSIQLVLFPLSTAFDVLHLFPCL